MMINQREKAIILFFASLTIFFVSFQFNFFNVANTKYFQTYDLGSEENVDNVNIKENDILEFQTGKRIVKNIKFSGTYINIVVDGDKLDPIKDGYPNKIKLIREKSNNEKI